MDNSLESDIHNIEKANIFEVGSRSPKWRGGVDSVTRKNRAIAYKSYGIGVTTASNSAAAFPKGEAPSETTMDNFTDGKINSYEVVYETSTKNQRQEVLNLLKRVDPNLTKLNLKHALDTLNSASIAVDQKTNLSIRMSLISHQKSGKRLTTIRFARNS